MANTVNKLINVANDEVGYLEKKSNKNLDEKLTNAGSLNYTKYGKWIGMNGQFWCASFVSWCFNQAYGKDALESLGIVISASCEVIRNGFIKKDLYFNRGEKKPKNGDVIFFKGSRHAGANHIGIVYKVDATYVYTIEGNTSGGSTVVDNGGGVAKKKYALSYDSILGYGRPKYQVETVYATVNRPVGLWFRKSCSMGNNKIVLLKDNTKVIIIKKNYGSYNGFKWSQIKYNGTIAYVTSKFLKF